jgi:ABC-2 type transport system ATP-binding protein
MIATRQETKPQQTSMPPRPTVASLEQVSKCYGPVHALRDMSLSIRSGELLALLGPNGAGKTTAVKLLLGLAVPSAGRVTVWGGDPTNPLNRVRTGAMLQVARVPETLRVREHIDLFSSYYPNPLPFKTTIALGGLSGLENRKFGDLSGGQKQRVLFALSLCGDPDLVFLDEPTVGLDVEARRTLWDEIRKLIGRGKTVLLTTHYLEEADALADRVVVINKGQIIAQGTPSEIKAHTSGKRIRCSSHLDLKIVQAIPAVTAAKQDRDLLEIQTAEAESVLRELLALDPWLSDIEVTGAGLEEAFLALTHDDKHSALSN